MRFVLRIGGSVIASPVNPALINSYVNMLKNLERHEHEIVVVVGGGTKAREFIGAAKELGLDERSQDEVAIHVSRIIAQLFSKKLGDLGCNTVPLTIDELAECLNKGKIAVMGGLKPGMTTDTVAALIVSKINADLFIKATDQDGIYDKDPRIHTDAVKLEHITFKDLHHVFAENKHKAGIHQVLDPEAVKVLKKAGIRVIVIDGFKPANILAAIKGEKIGTVISQ